MNIYDYAHALAKAIKASPEYKTYKQADEKLQKDKSAKEMLFDFRKAQLEMHKQKISGLEIAPEQEKRLSQMIEVINLNTTVKEYMEAEYRFSIMLGDIQKIISEPMGDIIAASDIAEEAEKQSSQEV